jgi:hypothetical protein
VRRFSGKVDVVGSNGEHVRYVPAELARAMVEAENAVIDERSGCIRSIKLIQTAQTHALRLGEPTGGLHGVRFAVKEKLDSGHVIWKFHSRSFERAD